MKVTLTFEDREALTADEISENLRHLYGDSAYVEVAPSGSSADSHIYFGLQKLLTGKQVESFFEDGTHLYQERLGKTRREILTRVEGILNQLIMDNEAKLIDE